MLATIRGTESDGAARRQAKSELERFFRCLQLPMPGVGEFFVTNSFNPGGDGVCQSSLIFLENYGVALRVYEKDYWEREIANQPVYPFVLQPLTRTIGNKFVYELYPGITIGATGHHYYESELGGYTQDAFNNYRRSALFEEEIIQEIFSEDGVGTNEVDDWNRGFLPTRTEDFPGGFPIVLDPKQVSRRNPTSAWVHPLSMKYKTRKKNISPRQSPKCSKPGRKTSGLSGIFCQTCGKP